MRTEDVLELIGQALEDWEVGPDAMRCAPEAPSSPPQRPLDRFSFIPALSQPAAPTLVELAGARDLSPFIADLDAWANRLAALMDVELLPWQRHVLDQWVGPQPGERVTVGFDGSSSDEGMVVAYQRGARIHLQWIDEALWDAAVEDHGPSPLPIDGHAYARRRRNRRRS